MAAPGSYTLVGFRLYVRYRVLVRLPDLRSDPCLGVCHGRYDQMCGRAQLWPEFLAQFCRIGCPDMRWGGPQTGSRTSSQYSNPREKTGSSKSGFVTTPSGLKCPYGPSEMRGGRQKHRYKTTG